MRAILINGSIAVVAAAAIFLALNKARHYRADGEAEAKAWFYDQRKQELYPAPRDCVSPDGDDDTRVKATVIGFQGAPNERSQLKVAYLEKYGPDLKALMQRANAAHAAKKPFAEKIPAQSSAAYLDNAFVKRVGEPSWHTAGSEEAREIMTEWRDWRGPQGQAPVISVP